MSFEYKEFEDGLVICGDCLDPEILQFVKDYMGEKKFDAFHFDPPYFINVKALDGKVEKWDKIVGGQQKAVDWMFSWTLAYWGLLRDNGAYWMWGGYGKNKFRPFFAYLLQMERREDMNMYLSDFITFVGKKFYGTEKRMGSVRQELLYITKGKEHNPYIFNKPYLKIKREGAGWNKDYPALSEYKRVTNVWSDITELFSKKIHSTQKPIELVSRPIEISTNEGSWVLDIFAGSGSTGFACRNLGRNFVLIEKEKEHYDKIVERMINYKAGDCKR